MYVYVSRFNTEGEGERRKERGRKGDKHTPFLASGIPVQREQQIQDPVADDGETHVAGFVARDAEVGNGGSGGLEGFPEEPGVREVVADGCFAGVGFVELGGEGVLEGGGGEVGGERVVFHCW